MVKIVNSRDIVVRGLEITGYRTRKLDTVPAGVYVHGHDRSVRIVGNHVHDIVKRYGEGGDIPRALTDYIKAREGYDYSHHGRVGNPDTEFVPDEIVERFCVLGTVEDRPAP